MWVNATCDEPIEAGMKKDLPRFLLYLRSMLREAYALAIVTIPTHLYQVMICTDMSSNLSLWQEGQ